MSAPFSYDPDPQTPSLQFNPDLSFDPPAVLAPPVPLTPRLDKIEARLVATDLWHKKYAEARLEIARQRADTAGVKAAQGEIDKTDKAILSAARKRRVTTKEENCRFKPRFARLPAAGSPRCSRFTREPASPRCIKRWLASNPSFTLKKSSFPTTMSPASLAAGLIQGPQPSVRAAGTRTLSKAVNAQG